MLGYVCRGPGLKREYCLDAKAMQRCSFWVVKVSRRECWVRVVPKR